ncbi:hypothetical protein [Paenibacillus sp. 1011MAR3C5]|nr:hypothetical protein [Paenibacillus sp. 1011MAR3C5]
MNGLFGFILIICGVLAAVSPQSAKRNKPCIPDRELAARVVD